MFLGLLQKGILIMINRIFFTYIHDMLGIAATIVTVFLIFVTDLLVFFLSIGHLHLLRL